MPDIILYTSKDGQIELDVSLANDTLWLSQQQIAELFGIKRPAITKHLKNIFNSQELTEGSVCSILERTASDGKVYKTKFYNLDAIISVGYRVNSAKATQFRMWATQVLKQHLIKGYTTHKTRLAEEGLQELRQTVELLQTTLVKNEFINDIGSESIQLIISYAKTWNILLAYDEDKLELLESDPSKTTLVLDYEVAIKAITTLKKDLISKREASDMFGNERNDSFQGILQTIEQTFDGIFLYPSLEIKAAHLLYFLIKDHPFTDGNKRIGCFMFLLYLKLQGKPSKFNENGLVALALLVAESQPAQKDLIIRLIVNLLMD